MSAFSDRVLRENGKDPNYVVHNNSSVRVNSYAPNQIDYSPILYVAVVAIILVLLITILVILIKKAKAVK